MKLSKATKNKIDELVLYSENDPELKEGLAWLDKTNKFPPDMDFYERVIRCLERSDASEKAKIWMDSKRRSG